MNDSLIARDLERVWHPCSQMKDYETFLPRAVAHANGCYIELTNKTLIIDAISSWWCKSLGHSHPRLRAALVRQMNQFEHVMLANFTHEPIVALSEQLATLTTTLDKVLYASDGSCAVEMALKMSLHAQQLLGQPQRSAFAALSNGYHGETGLALSVSDMGIYRKPYESVLTPCYFLQGIPYVSGKEDPLWDDCSMVWPAIEQQLEALEQQPTALCAIIVEPIVQGSAGMRIYSADCLRRIAHWAKKKGVYLIADEIMTGLGRTGLALACDHAGIEPDFICLSKGLTAGFLPLSAVLTSTQIYQLFYADYSTNRAFLHSHTHTGNALAAAVALETLAILESDALYARVTHLETQLLTHFRRVAEKTQMLTNLRSLGGLVAGDLIIDPSRHPPRLAYQIYQKAMELGALLRPLGNTIYWMPPFIIEDKTLEELEAITTQAILHCR